MPDSPPEPERQEDLPEFDFVDPLKRDEEDSPPGLDPIVTVPADN
ncbi:MAG: hypothetical protein QOH95_2256 [Gaiellaceae bacterium]|nr:hypothetical protein [Gaiellaceae bacterium]